VQIVRVRGGNQEVLASAFDHAPVYIPNYVDLSVEGKTICLTLNGRKILEAEDNSVPQGRAGFFADSVMPVQFREIEIYEGKAPERYIPLMVCKQPYVLWAMQSEAILMWETNRPSAATVRFGNAEVGWRSVRVPPSACLQKVVLKNLKPNTLYQFRIESEGQQLGTGSFHTDVGPNRPFVIGVLGDNQQKPVNFERLNRLMMRHRPHFVINVGDVVTTGALADHWDTEFFTPGRDMFRFAPCYVSIGNHEGNSIWFRHYLPYPEVAKRNPDEDRGHYYAYKWGNAAFVVFDTQNDFKPGSRQYEWLEQTLSSSWFKQATWKFVYCHQPAFSVGWSKWPGNKDVQTYVVPLLEKYGVDIFIGGHTHSYERGVLNNVIHIINGGGGCGDEDYGRNYPHVQRFGLILQYSIVKIDGDRLEFTCYDFSDKVFDHFVLEKGKPRTLPGAPKVLTPPTDGQARTQTIVVTYPDGGSMRVRYRVAIKERADKDEFWTPSARLYPAGEPTSLLVDFKEPGTYHVMVQALDEMLRPSEWTVVGPITIK
jgi:predicted phosphodiesterase